LEELTAEEQRLLFICRDHYRSIPVALLLFLKSIDWTRPLQVQEAYKYLDLWTPMQPEDSLALLMSEYPDETIRAYAVEKVDELSDEDFHLYMLQLVQAITFENFHNNSLGQVLLNRALKNPYQVGHYLFWTLRSQLHVKSKAERLGLLLERFIMLCTSYREDLSKQVNFFNFYSEQAEKLSDKDSYQDRERQLKGLIESNCDRAQNLCTLPVDSSIEVSGPVSSGCKVMDSKKMPLWLTLSNSESGTENIPIIFKTGDDLRQDILSLQLIRVMDMIWLENGLDLRMKPYQVIATGDQCGIIEAVKNAETTAKIHREYGGALGALKDGTFKDYLNEHNPSEKLMQKALDNFIRSSAGYCVATYILGIGDRHNGNIMITRTGHLFHIDFGHFLGNFKTAMGIQRERSKFVLTAEMVFAMGGKESTGFTAFKDYCGKAYNYIRNHGKRFINLFLFMVTAGMPELTKKKEIEYLREMLSLKLTEMEAKSKFLEEIENSLNNTFRRFDNLMHNFKH
jgi:phosphatidylinositol-4,5-bisphosphate 3-kinase